MEFHYLYLYLYERDTVEVETSIWPLSGLRSDKVQHIIRQPAPISQVK